jgi:hypothetical protein
MKIKLIEKVNLKKDEGNTPKDEFLDLLTGLQDYVENTDEKIENAEQVSRIYNTITELEDRFAGYEDSIDDDEKSEAADYCTQMYDVIDSLKAMADSYADSPDSANESNDYAEVVDDAFNQNPESALEQAGLTD